MTVVCRALVIALVLVLGANGPASGREGIVGVASVIDGDTIEIHGQPIRFHGIDAPESSQLCHRENGEPWRCGQQAALAMSDKIGRSVVRCDPKDRDRYGRIVAICFKDTLDLSRWMVDQGWAVAYRKYSLDYVADEDRARMERRNIWSGSFELPWDWRAKKKK